MSVLICRDAPVEAEDDPRGRGGTGQEPLGRGQVGLEDVGMWCAELNTTGLL